MNNFVFIFNLKKILPLFIFVMSFAQNLLSAESFDSQVWMCTRQKEIRWVRVSSSGDGKCKTLYSKDGFIQVVSSATFFTPCEAVMQNIKRNIEDGGFKCELKKMNSMIEIE